MIYQSYNLFPKLTVLENAMVPLLLQKKSKQEAQEAAARRLAEVGIGEDMFKRYPNMLSGGEQQRVAIARALTTGARIILADEPTGNLDVENSEHIIRILHTLAREQNYCVVVVTHDLGIAEAADQVLRLQDGRILPEL